MFQKFPYHVLRELTLRVSILFKWIADAICKNQFGIPFFAISGWHRTNGDHAILVTRWSRWRNIWTRCLVGVSITKRKHNFDMAFSGWWLICGNHRSHSMPHRICTWRCCSSSWWRHQMETFFALLALCGGNPPVTHGFPSQKGQWRGALMFSSILAWTNGWANSRYVRRRFETPSRSLWRHCNGFLLASPLSSVALLHIHILLYWHWGNCMTVPMSVNLP